MNRFEEIGNVNVNIDKIRCFYREGERGENIIVELDDGRRVKAHDKRKIIEGFIRGDSHIIQVIPCVKQLYARYIENGKEFECPIYYLGLCADGYVRPLDVYGMENMMFADDVGNYIGLYSETLEEEKENT